MQVEDFDELWDRLIESDLMVGLDEFLRRVQSLCLHIRFGEEAISQADLRRETFMCEQIESVRHAVTGPILVVTGGFHSSALAAHFAGIDLQEQADGHATEDHAEMPADVYDADTSSGTVPMELTRGIALTTYSYERLDSLTGYNSGMPNPGFYEWAWQCRSKGEAFSHHPVLADLVAELRSRQQVLSTADLIAIETSALGLAALRGRSHVWRGDLVDAVSSVLVKDELSYDCNSPFLDAVHAVLRGKRRGRLAAGTRMPPLVIDIGEHMKASAIELKRSSTPLSFDLQNAKDLSRSRLLHRLRLLEIVGIKLVHGTDFLARQDMEKLWESWELRWTPDFESSCIEASRFGTSLVDAVAARLVESAQSPDLNAADAGRLLVESCQSGIDTLSPDLLKRLDALISSEPGFTVATEALGHLTYLYCHDETFGTQRATPIGTILGACYTRCLWLLDSLGKSLSSERKALAGMRMLQEVTARGADIVGEGREELVGTLTRVLEDTGKHPSIRGAAVGMLWNTGQADPDGILKQLLGFSEPNDLGDFLVGLFALAREVAQRHPQVVQTVDRLLMEFSGERFQQALPSLRLAFTYFTPREKHFMLTTLFESLGIKETRQLPQLNVSSEVAAEALAIEDRIFSAIETYGLEMNHE